MTTNKHTRFRTGLTSLFTATIITALTIGSPVYAATSDLASSEQSGTSTAIEDGSATKDDSTTNVASNSNEGNLEVTDKTEDQSKETGLEIPKNITTATNDKANMIGNDTVASQTPVATAAAAPQADEDINTWMPDKELQLAVLESMKDMGLLDSSATVLGITKDKLSQLTHLSGDSFGIVSLEGLQYATSMTNLSLVPDLNVGHNWGKISDLTPLKDLSALKDVNLSENQIYDISALSNKPNLVGVSLGYNHITDISPLQTSPNLKSGFEAPFQYVQLPVMMINKNATNSVTTPSVVIKNYANKNVPITPYIDSPGFFVSFKSTATGTNTDDYTINWTDLLSSTAANKFLTYKWSDDFNGESTATFMGAVIQQYKVSDTMSNVTVHYQNTNGLQLELPNIINGTVGDSYDLSANESVKTKLQNLQSQGYTLVRTEGNATGEFSEQSQNVTYVLALVDSKTTINSVNQDDHTTILNADGTPKTIEYADANNQQRTVELPKELDGYYLKDGVLTPMKYVYSDVDKASNFVLQSTGADKLTYQLTLKQDISPQSLSVYYKPEVESINVHYVDESQQTIKGDSVISGNFGTQWSVTPENITGYTYKYAVDNAGNKIALSGIYDTNLQDITLVYEAKADNATIVFHYKDTAGHSLRNDTAISGEVGSSWSVTAPKIKGYSFVKMVSDSGEDVALSGNYLTGNNENTMIYKKDETKPVPSTPDKTKPTDKLPQTGEQSSTGLVFGGIAIMIAILGRFFFKYRNN